MFQRSKLYFPIMRALDKRPIAYRITNRMQIVGFHFTATLLRNQCGQDLESLIISSARHTTQIRIYDSQHRLDVSHSVQTLTRCPVGLIIPNACLPLECVANMDVNMDLRISLDYIVENPDYTKKLAGGK
ncbi:hypothetical protein CEXT_489891 [Caerostris extrusa]|uniref:Uncharacterized protein n=1 Tax=Caerostris extrusa TaxID=172846 RepID=A0AAV4W979_CAEEX|nr:hypothetical protein CEXT_489891 [Caerostris extrusa]